MFNQIVELLLEQPHMDFDVQGYNVLFDPELESKNYEQAVDLFIRILSGEEVTGKYNSSIHLPKGFERSFVQSLIKDVTSMNFIKLWLSAIGKKTNTSYTISQFFKDTGMFQFIKESIEDRKTYRVTHYGLGISEKTTAKDKKEAIRNVFGRLLDDKRISKTAYEKFKDAEAKEIKTLQEKQMRCWKGYKKKGTKKLPSGKTVNNCVKQ
jgi:hypothetical protein